MSGLRTAASVLLLSYCLLHLSVPPSDGQESSSCSCNDTNSRCDESGTCRCDPGWDGEHCEHCVPMPGCRHGTCQQPWQCECEAGWAGRFCDKDLAVCSEQQPCQHGATCLLEDSGDYSCLCPAGFHGRSCQLRAGPCLRSRSPCLNGGLCEDADGFAAELTCRCLAGFSGRHCQTDLDDCLMQPCANGATCLDGVNRFSCVCPAGFSGRFCTVNRDDCASRPCQNGARCLDRAAGFRCLCPPAFTGATCETPMRAPPGLDSVGVEGGGGGDDSERLLRVTVSERSSAPGGLSQVQLLVLLLMAVVTVAAMALTAALVLQRRCRVACGHARCRQRRRGSGWRGEAEKKRVGGGQEVTA